MTDENRQLVNEIVTLIMKKMAETAQYVTEPLCLRRHNETVNLMKNATDRIMEVHQDVKTVQRGMGMLEIEIERHKAYHNGETTGEHDVYRRAKHTATWIGLAMTMLAITTAAILWIIRQVSGV